ncbi:hypothetical protein SDC9_180598 [bioreactor metagenome]|uniref:Uncharacterized protein n=1 Tax=bioreactor metagenome TaxID=1076179 RepID=A0A645H271_9ZZZZ
MANIFEPAGYFIPFILSIDNSFSPAAGEAGSAVAPPGKLIIGGVIPVPMDGSVGFKSKDANLSRLKGLKSYSIEAGILFTSSLNSY